MIGVEHHGHAIDWSDGSDVVSRSDGSCNTRRLVLVVYALSGEVRGTALRGLEDDWRLLVSSSF
jgi:hypothetical protein